MSKSLLVKGTFVFYEMSEVKTDKKRLEELGFGEFVPRNDYKTALIKAIKSYTKGNDKLYRRFNDVAETVCFSVFIEHTVGDDLNLAKEITIKLDKETGKLTGAPDEIQKRFEEEAETIDSQQLRALILKSLRRTSHAISMRTGGGIYFVDQRFSESLQKLRELFRSVQGAKLYEVPVYNESATLEAIEDATANEIFGDIESVIAEVTREFNSGFLTERRLKSKIDEAKEIMKKVKLHGENLRDRSESVAQKAERLQALLESTTKNTIEGVKAEEGFLATLQNL